MRHLTLKEWLEYIEQAHSTEIDMGLTRIRKVFSRLELSFSKQCIVSVAGTNGKGSTCRFIEQAGLRAGLKVGLYSSPHIERFNERIRVAGLDVEDEVLCQAFEQIDNAREEISLTYFEFATLCALVVFSQAQLDLIILEVGLGGRLDATNIIDADVGVITSIGLDHQSYLGDTLDEITREKAGIIKQKQHVVVGYTPLEPSIQELSQLHNGPVYLRGRDFGLDCPDNKGVKDLGSNEIQATHVWLNALPDIQYQLSEAALPKQNIATAIMALHCVKEVFEEKSLEPISKTTSNTIPNINRLFDKGFLNDVITTVGMSGRYEIVSTYPKIILDVGHNEAAAEYLCNRLSSEGFSNVHILVGMLKDKNIEATLSALKTLNATFYCIDLPGPRGAKASRLLSALEQNNQSARAFVSFKAAYECILSSINDDDGALLLGSFLLASEYKNYTKTL